MANPTEDGDRISSSPGPARRPRAPTITIDTSAVRSPSISDMGNPVALDNLSDTGRHLQGDTLASPNLRPQSQSYQASPTEPRPRSSFDSRESRPTSPHNVISPTQWHNPENLLAVPGFHSRRNSIESETEHSTSSETYVNSTATESPHQRKENEASGHEILSDDEALKPDPGNEADFERENNPFAFAPGHMTKLFNPKSLGAFHALGGLSGLEKGLRTNRVTGLSPDEQRLDGAVSFEDAVAAPHQPQDKSVQGKGASALEAGASKSLKEDAFADRKRIFNDNRLPEKKAKTLLQLAWMAYNDKVLLLLTGAAAISLALGLYETFGQKHEPGEPRVEWVEGVAIIVAILIVVIVGAINDWQKERQFVKLNRKKDNRMIKAIRSGRTQEISVYDILVGDVVLLEPGDMVPVDGIFIDGHNIKCDESSATGESDILKKTPADDVYRAMENNEPLKKMDPFIISGAKIQEGVGTFLVTATGVNSSYGKTMMSLREENEPTPLQSKLNVLAEQIAKLGGAAALLLFVILLIMFLARLPKNSSTPAQKGQQFMQILIQSVTIVVVAVPEGLPLAVTLALAFATKRMMKDNNLVRVLRSCETMGNATSICSDKTGTLTQNVMTVVAGSIGTTSRFSSGAAEAAGGSKGSSFNDVSTPEFIGTLDSDVKSLWKDSIAINSTAFEGEENGKQVFVGSKTETALLTFAQEHLGMGAVSVERSNANVVQMVPFDSGRKCMAVVLKIGKIHRLLVKGASEIMLRHCTSIVRDPTASTASTLMNKENVETLNNLIDAYANRSLRTIGFLYRDFEQWPPRNARRLEDDKTQARFEDVLKEMTFLGVVGIQDPLRPGVAKAVQDCILAGVFPRMVTGDNIMTAKAIATECGIFTAGGVALEGPQFRKMTKKQKKEIIPKLQVLARSSPEDKRILVRTLKEMGETVAVTGDGTNDAPALKAADVGFSMGIAGTEVAKEASDIILMDDNFSSIVKALMWGRAVNDAVRKFLQFQITVNITAVVLAFVTAIASSDGQSVLTAVQLLWVNLIMDTFAALALATDPPAHSILNRKPSPKSAPLISLTMWKMIIGQAIFQIVVTFVLFFAGVRILSYDTESEQLALRTLTFNTFVWFQIFNELNCRRLDNKLNIFEGIQKNSFFIIITLIMIVGQILIIFFGGVAFSIHHQNGAQWGYAIVLGALSIPIGVCIRLIPDELAAKCVPDFLKRRSKPEVVVSDEEAGPGTFAFNQALMDIRDELAFIRRIRGGRLSSLEFKIKHPIEAWDHSRAVSRSRSSSLAQTPIVAASEGEAQGDNSHSPAPATPESRHRRTASRR
ncbi:plasma membrane calcium, partial [Elasticomyces elasticus]